METINCPLCFQKNVISKSDFKQVTTIHPGQEGVIGNYTLGCEGGIWEYSHAYHCPNLKEATDKEGILRYHLRDVEVWKSDQRTPEDYNKLLNSYGLQLYPSVKREFGKWVYRISIRETRPFGRSTLFTNGDTMDSAFNKIRHRLLCGEVFSLDELNHFQFKVSDSDLSVSRL